MMSKLGTTALAVAAVLVAAALLAVAGVRGGGDSSAGPSVEPAGSAPVSSVGRACPAFGTGKNAPAPLDVANVTLRSDESADGGENTAAKLPADKLLPALGVSKPGAWAKLRVGDDKTRSVAINASGGLAPFSDAFVATRPADGLGSGLAVSSCPRASASSWFVGAGSTAKHPSTLVLTNPSGMEAVVDVAMYGVDGEISVVGGTGIVVDAHDTVRVPLERLATGEDDMAVSVRTSRGTVSASMLDATGELNPYSGSEYLPATARPANETQITGVPADSGRRRLLVANPGDQAANVSVNVVGKDGTYAPSGLENVSVGAGSVKSVELPGSLPDRAVSIRLSSEVPVTGSVRATTGGDVAYATATEPADGPVALPVRLGDALSGADTQVVATSGSAKNGGSLRVRAYAADGSVVGDASKISLGAGTTSAFDPVAKTGAPADRVAYVSITPDDVGAHLAVTYRDGDASSVVPLTSLPDKVVRPAVAPGGLR